MPLIRQGGCESRHGKSKLKEEAYSLRVTPGGALITAMDTRGFYYGMKTLEQLLLRRGGRRPLPPAISWTGRILKSADS
ncbi:MAG: glycoside hydrolase family 20 zincin-like fold domain-containing protein [Akkermansia sp.]